MNIIKLYLDISPNEDKPRYKAELAISGIEITGNTIKISLVVPSTVALEVGTRIVLLYGMFGNQCGHVIRCRLDEVSQKYLKCSF